MIINIQYRIESMRKTKNRREEEKNLHIILIPVSKN